MNIDVMAQRQGKTVFELFQVAWKVVHGTDCTDSRVLDAAKLYAKKKIPPIWWGSFLKKLNLQRSSKRVSDAMLLRE